MMRRRVAAMSYLAQIAMMCWATGAAHAQPGMPGGISIRGPTGRFQAAASSPDGTGESIIMDASFLQYPTQMDFTTLATTLPTWTFTMGSVEGRAGTISIQDYEATAHQAQGGGADLVPGYNVGTGDPPLQSLQWIQIINTTDPVNGRPNPYVDNQPDPNYTGPTLPFYYEEGGSKFQGSYGFEDGPWRNWPASPNAPNVNTTTWTADLLLASLDAPTDADGNGGDVTVYGGMQWGFTLYEYPPAPEGMGIGGAPGVGADGVYYGAVQSVPEPSGLILLGLGVGLAALARSRRRLGPGAMLLSMAAAWPPAMADEPPPAMVARAKPNPRNCELRLSFPSPTFRPGDDVLLESEFINRSPNRTVTVWESRWCFNHWIEIQGDDGPDPHPTTTLREWREQLAPPGRDRNIPHRMQPGGRYREKPMNIGLLYDLEPGAYRVRLTYYENGSRDGELKVVSNWARFRIEGRRLAGQVPAPAAPVPHPAR